MNNANKLTRPILKASKEQGNVINHEYEGGLTKREAFAMAAMQGMLACDKIHDDMNASLKQGGNARIEIARAAINLADSLLKELEEM